MSEAKFESDMPLRMRRIRRTDALRRLVRENHLRIDQMIYPLFVTPEPAGQREVTSMPGVYQMSIPVAVEACRQAWAEGIVAVLLFGLPPQSEKDSIGQVAWKDDGVVQKAVRAIKKALPEMCVIADLCFCEYTDHGHCGVLTDAGDVDNDATLENLELQALALADAGAQVVAPSGMMDGMIGSIRTALDEAGYFDVSILSYAVKYASGFYGPFRDAADSAPAFGDRSTYQMDPANAIEALRELELDLEQGADMVMVKPALPYLDIVRAVKERAKVPVCAYEVSGEYAMIKAAGAKGWIDEQRVMLESLLSIKRAGADFILTYFAREVAKLVP